MRLSYNLIARKGPTPQDITKTKEKSIVRLRIAHSIMTFFADFPTRDGFGRTSYLVHYSVIALDYLYGLRKEKAPLISAIVKTKF